MQLLFFQRQSARGRGVPRPRPQAAPSSESSPGGNSDELDLNQFAKFIELLTNPTVKDILKPEVAEALDTLRGANGGDVQGAPPSGLEPENQPISTYMLIVNLTFLGR